MPSPIAHLSAGYAVYSYYKKRLPESRIAIWKLPLQMIVVMSLSVLPDLDVIPAIVFRDMHRYHNNFSHSFFFAIPVAFVIGGILQRVYGSNFWLWYLICLISYDLHTIMDALTAERGVMMFWPLSQTRFAFPIKIFYGLQWGLGWFSIWHLWTILTEALFGSLVILAVNSFDKRRRQSHAATLSKK